MTLTNNISGYEKAKLFGLMQVYFACSLLLIMGSLKLNQTEINPGFGSSKDSSSFENTTREGNRVYMKMAFMLPYLEVLVHFVNSILFLASCLSTRFNVTDQLDATFSFWSIGISWREFSGGMFGLNLILLGISLKTLCIAATIFLLHMASSTTWNLYWKSLNTALSGDKAERLATGSPNWLTGFLIVISLSFLLSYPNVFYDITIIQKNCTETNFTLGY